MFESAVERAGLTLDDRLPAAARAVYVDREMWAKIVMNLLSNALKFTFDGRHHGARCGRRTARRG